MEEDSKGTGLGNVIRIDDERVRDHLGHIVRGTVEETLNAMLEAEADRLCNAERYERTQAERATVQKCERFSTLPFHPPSARIPVSSQRRDCTGERSSGSIMASHPI